MASICGSTASRIRAKSREANEARFTVPAGARQVRIISRSVIPADLDPTTTATAAA